jgi:rhodanese-related sulfurtransferase
VGVAACDGFGTLQRGQSSDQPAAASKASTTSCLASFNDVSIGREKDRPLLVDVRPAVAYAGYRIPGSVNIPLYALKTKRYLRARSIVLVADGNSQRQLLTVCGQLKDQQFRHVQVLAGGMPSWVLHGGDVIGQAPVSTELVAIAPRQFFKQQASQHWILALDPTASDQDKGLFAGHSIILLGKSPESSVARIRALAAKREGKAPLRVLVVQASIDNAYLSRIAHGLGDVQVRYLSGGVEAYRAYLEARSAILSPIQQPLSTRKRCAG